MAEEKKVAAKPVRAKHEKRRAKKVLFLPCGKKIERDDVFNCPVELLEKFTMCGAV